MFGVTASVKRRFAAIAGRCSPRRVRTALTTRCTLLPWYDEASNAGLVHLDRDDRGMLNDVINVNGRELVNPLNQEVVTVRGVVQAAVAWWFAGNLLNVWLTLAGLAATMKLAEFDIEGGSLTMRLLLVPSASCAAKSTPRCTPTCSARAVR